MVWPLLLSTRGGGIRSLVLLLSLFGFRMLHAFAAQVKVTMAATVNSEYFRCGNTLHSMKLDSIWLEVQGRASRGLHIFWDHFWIFIALFWVRRGFKMILSHMAPSSFNMSSYRAIWTHVRRNFVIFIDLILQLLASGTCPRYIHHRFTIDSR